jgi:nucleoside-diphosphate-sugar epimerase
LGLFKAVKKGIFPIIGGGRTTLHPTYIDDLIQGFERCIEKKDTTGDNVYFIAGEEIVSVATLANAIAKALNVSPPKIYLPIWLTRLGASILEPIGRRFRFEPPLTKAKINFFTQSRGVNISKAKRELGYEPTVGLEQGLVKTVEWYRKYGYL